MQNWFIHVREFNGFKSVFDIVIVICHDHTYNYEIHRVVLHLIHVQA